jgi:hypothetical protein
MKKITTLIIAIIGIFGMANAQGDYEAFTFSQSDYYGTARFMGAGGAFGATGGDFSAVSTNPASIGLFKRHEISITPMSLVFGYTDTYYYNEKRSSQTFKYTVPQCGIVLANSIRNGGKWRSWQFGFGYNRIMDFNTGYRASATTPDNLGEVIAPHANGTDYQTFNSHNVFSDASLAWYGYMIDTIPGTRNLYYSPFSDNLIYQKATVLRSGAIDEMTFTFGGNYNDKLYVGATVGFPFLNYREKTTYTETPEEATDIQGIREYTFYTQQRNSGTGVNLKLGIIYQPADFVRIGIGFHTPTYYWRIKDNFYRELTTAYTSMENTRYYYENLNYFKLTTPLKFNVSTSFLIKKRAFIAAEYEFMNYGMAKMYDDNYDYDRENEAIADKYGASHNVRVGAEVNISQGFALRAGYRLKTSPYKLNDTPYNNTVHFVSAGLGFRSKFFFFDLAYVLRMSKDAYWLYDPMGVPCNTSTKTHNVVATIGFKF